MIKDFRNKKHWPITAQQVRDDLAEADRKRKEAEERPIKEAEAQLHANHLKLFELGRTAVLNSEQDPFFELPESAVGLSMPHAEVADFVAKEAARFVAENPDFFPCRENHQAMMKYIMDQKKDILIPNADVFKAVFERLSRLDLLVQKPEPKPEPEPEPAPIEEPEKIEQEAPPQSEELTDGWDIVTGEPRKYTQAEIWKLSSADLKKAFKMWTTRDGDRRPLIRRSMFQ
jgi:hypothetical protein